MDDARGEAPQIDIDGMAAHLAAQPDVAAAYLFGSVARGEAGPMSDVDVAVLFVPGLDAEATLERRLQLMGELEQLLGQFVDREVQVVSLAEASPLLAYEVIREGRLIQERDAAARIEFEVRAMKLYLDVRPMLAEYDRALARRIQEVGLGTGRRHTRSLSAAQRIRARLTGPPGS